MRLFSITLFLLICSVVFAQNDYVIHVNDTLFELCLDRDYQILVNDELVTFRLNAKDTLSYDDELYSFNYSKDYKISKLVIDDGLEQIMIMTAEGSGILIQQYTILNPTMLNEMMISEVTKESLNYGFELTREDYKKELISGEKLDVARAVLRYKDEVNIYEVASVGNKDEGIIIMTMRMDELIGTEGQKIIDLMWGSLTYK